MPTNIEVAETFREIADLLDVLGEKFKPDAYRRAARSIDSLTEDLSAVVARDELRTIPGVGEAIADKIRELVTTGHLAYREKLVTEVPPGLIEIMRLPGLGPKTARRFWTELGIEGPKELTAAIEAGRLTGVKGFGPKKIEQIRAALAPAGPSVGAARRPIGNVYPIARRLWAALAAEPSVERCEIAGSFRRCQETVGDLDLLATSTAPERVFDRFSALPEIGSVRLRGSTKETVLLTNGMQVDLRVVEPAAYGAALQYFTGSKEHNVTLRTLARDQGLKINEYGVFRGDERIAGRTEEEVYASLGLAWIPPEIRVDRGEIDLAALQKVPELVAASDLTGELHLHLAPGATTGDLDRALAAARQRKYATVGLVVAGIDADGTPFRLPGELADRAVGPDGPSPGVVPVVELGPSPPRSELASVTSEYRLVRPVGDALPSSLPEGTRGVVHLGSGTGSAELLRGWITLAARAGASVEVGPGPERLDSNVARFALESHARLSIPTGIGTDEFDPILPIGLGFARRAGASPQQVTNGAAPAAPEPRSRSTKRGPGRSR
jgi:DNA polymerase/3'-5' exonuclease PolX